MECTFGLRHGAVAERARGESGQVKQKTERRWSCLSVPNARAFGIQPIVTSS
jgi:hypothetical protein